MKRRFIILVILCLVVQLTAFGKDNSLEKVLEKGYFTVGLDDTFAPMGFRDKDGNIAGFDIDLAKEVAKRMGVEARFKSCDWDGIIFELRSKKIDLIWNGLTITEKRKKQILFSNPYFTGNQSIVVKSGSSIKNISDLKGKTVGLQLGSTSATALEESSISKDIKRVNKYGSNVEALLDLQAGRTDAVVIDSMVGKYYVSQKEKKDNKDIFRFLKESLRKEEVGVGMRKNDLAFKNKVDSLIKEIKADKTYKKIYDKWFTGVEKNNLETKVGN